MVDRVIQGAMPAPADFTLTWEANHFTKGQEGLTYTPFTIVVDKALRRKQVAYYIRVVEKGAPPPPPRRTRRTRTTRTRRRGPTYPVGAHLVHAGARPPARCRARSS